MNDLSRVQVLQRITPWLLGFYFVALFLLFLAELGVPVLQDYFRATNQVLILLVLLILPVVIIGMSRFIHSLTVKISGQDLHLELSELRYDMKKEVSQVESNLGGQISSAEQALWPILAGVDLGSVKRLEQKHLIIGAKQDSSQLFFASLMAMCIEKHVEGSQCEVRFPNGGSMKNLADLKHRWIDMYVDYTGTGCQYFNINHQGKSQSQIFTELNQYSEALGFTWLDPFGASEDYCLVMSPESAKKFDVYSLKDLKIAAPKLVFSGDPEFLNRQDCYLGMQKYGIEFKSTKPCRVEHRYEAMINKEADVFVGYETDPELYSGIAIRLEDPDDFFPRYVAAPLVSRHALSAIPELAQALQKLDQCLSTEQLIMAVNKISKHENDINVARGLAKDIVDRLP